MLIFNKFFTNLMKNSEKKSNQKPNRLINENNPYLLQHAYNPVNWYPGNNCKLIYPCKLLNIIVRSSL